MKLHIFCILLLFLVQPLQSSRYMKLIDHVLDPAAASLGEPTAASDEPHSHPHHEQAHRHAEPFSAAAAPEPAPGEHRHSPEEPAHDHAKDFWASSAHVLISNPALLVTKPLHTAGTSAGYGPPLMVSQSILSNLLRPPICA